MAQFPSSCVIIGATGGVGSALTRRLAGKTRLTLAARDADRLQTLADEVDARFVRADASSFEQMADLFEQAGEIDAAVNLAGSILLKPAHLTSEADLHDTISQNLVTAFATVRAASRAMRGGGGSIVLMSSAAARYGLTNHEAIAAAKAGVEGLTRAAAASYAARSIRVNAVAPGLVDSPMAKGITGNETALAASRAMHPLGRIGEPDEIARVIEWLISPESSWITGQVIGVDGGLSAVQSRAAR
ncbi:MAG: SDR family NAD(P)-dependent oxidoreductase [Phycisphaerales bacterium JB039]